MNGSTVVIVPPSGDMKLYIESLELLRDYPLQTMAPGHGAVIEDPEDAVTWLIGHRLKREKKVVAGLQELGTADLDALVKVVYDDVDESIHHMAKLSLTAHLIKLEQEHQAGRNVSDEWTLLGH
nr:MBL fold metallo-hydrolase [Halieaceae bacterium]